MYRASLAIFVNEIQIPYKNIITGAQHFNRVVVLDKFFVKKKTTAF